MANKDVELIVKARDQASKALSAISDAFKELSTDQSKLQAGAQKTDASLASLGAEFSKLNAEIKGLTALSKVSTQIDKAATAVSRMEAEFEQANKAAQDLALRTEQAAASFGKLEAEAKSAAAQVDKEKNTLAGLRKEAGALDDQIDRASTGFTRLAQRINATRAPAEALKQSYRDQLATILPLVERQAALERQLAQQTAAYERASQAQREANNAARQAANNQANLIRQSEQAADALTAQAAGLEKARTEFGAMRSAAEGAATSLNQTTLDQKELGAAAQKTAETLKRVTEALKAQQAQQANSQAVARGPDVGPLGKALAEYRRLKTELDSANTALAKVEQETREAGGASAILAAELTLAQQAAQRAAVAFAQQDVAVRRMGQAMREAKDANAAQALRETAQQAAVLRAQSAGAESTLATLARTLFGIGRAANDTAGDMERLNQASRRAAAGVGTWGEHTRRALSLGQRLRGEVLSIATAYIGLYQSITQIGGVIAAIRTVEAASSRLGVVFEQDTAAVKNELRFLAAEAGRLGQNFGTLADEYSKFAVVTKQAGFSLESTRTIFKSLTEAARVNKLSQQDLSLVFLALTQSINKGKFTMEEVSRQLGERLPGAVNILGTALGHTNEELFDLFQRGKLFATEDNVLKFATELNKRFGPQLADSLKTTTAQLDRFGNNLFIAQQQVAEGGFAKALQDALVQLNKFFESDAGRKFFNEIGNLLGVLVQGFTLLASNLDNLLVALKIAAVIVGGQFLRGIITQLNQTKPLLSSTTDAINVSTASWRNLGIVISTTAGSFRTFLASLIPARVALTGINVQLALTRVAAGAAAAGLAVLRGAMTALAVAGRTLLAAIGGIPGIILTIISLGIGLFFDDMAKKAGAADEALSEHEAQLTKVAQAYREAKDAGEEFNAALSGVSLASAEANLDKLATAYVAAKKDIEGMVDALRLLSLQQKQRGGVDPLVRELTQLTNQFKSNSISAKSFLEQLDLIYKATDDPAVKKLVQQFAEIGGKAREVEVRLGQQAAVAKALGSTIQTLDSYMRNVGVSMAVVTGEVESQGDAMAEAEKRALAYADALKGINEFIPRVVKQQKQAEDRAEIERLFAQGTAAATSDAERNALAAARKEALRVLAEDNDAAKERARLAKQAADEEERRRKAIAEAKADLQFEIDQLNRTKRDQAVAAALNSNGFTAADATTDVDAKEIARLAGEKFDRERVLELDKQILDLAYKLREQRGLITREQFIANEALRAGIDLTSTQGKIWSELVGQLYDQEEAQNRLAESVDNVRAIEAERTAAARELRQLQLDAAPQDAIIAQGLEVQLLTDKLVVAKDEAIALATALGDEKVLASLLRINTELETTKTKLFDAAELNQMFASGASNAFGSVGDVIGKWIDGTEKFGEGLVAVRDAFRSFAADFLRQIAQMIIKQLILNALQATGFGGGGEGFLNSLVGSNHTGGMAGTGQKRRVNPAWFTGAVRYHEGGIVGLKPGEVPSILKRNEEVLTADDPRHMFNGGGSRAQDIKVINTIDSGDFVSKGMETEVGQRAILNFIRANPGAFRNAMGS